MSVSTWCESCHKTYLKSKYSGILLSTFIHVSTIWRFLYIQYMISLSFFFFNKCTAWKKKILLKTGTALNTKTNMGQPHTNWRPRESLAHSPATALLPGKISSTHAPVGPVGPWHLHGKCPLPPSPPAPAESGSPRRAGGQGMRMSGNQRDERDVLQLKALVSGHPGPAPGRGGRAGAVLIELARSAWTSWSSHQV